MSARATTTVPGATPREARAEAPRMPAYFLVGLLLGLTLIKVEAVSWFRIQEMFRFHSFHMYGVMLGALLVALPSVTLLKRLRATTWTGEPIRLTPKEMGRCVRYPAGGLLFGIGWALTGACPGPLFALLGAGVFPIVVVIGAAVLGNWTYGMLRPRLPH